VLQGNEFHPEFFTRWTQKFFVFADVIHAFCVSVQPPIVLFDAQGKDRRTPV
jgi:hypothetical protein